ncbi:mitochondrial DNA repair [Mactra antiquata]
MMRFSTSIIGTLVRYSTSHQCFINQYKHSCVMIKRSYCEKFDISKVTLSNRENSSLDGVKKAVKKTVKKTKTKLEVTQSTDTDIVIPECFSVLLELPLTAEKKVDKGKLEEFKQIIEEIDIKYLPSVSTVIKATESKKQKEVLENWKKQKIEELGGEEKFLNYQKKTLGKGLNLHKCIELTLKGQTEDVNINPNNEGHWRSVKDILDDVKDTKVIEEPCVHPEMFYNGKVDCVADFRGNMSLIEWKTSSKMKPILSSTYDNPLQVVAYMGAINRSGILKQYNVPCLKHGALVFAYPSGEPATVHLMSSKICEKYWQQWLKRVFNYWTIQYKASSLAS